MPATNHRPLVTFTIGAYNQEAFIRQAVEGAFAQTYSPLQIILSDDCSGDRTFEIMAKMASVYRGPHEVVLNRNPKNLGLVGHVNRVVQLMRGELLVVSAGDDISLPTRTEETWQAWESTGRKAFAVHAGVINIDENYQPDDLLQPVNAPGKAAVFQDGPSHLKGYLRTGSPVVMGCTAAYSRDLFDRFGPMPEYLVYEDMALTFRALISGGLAYIDRPLVLYRLHSNNIHHSKNEYVVNWNDLLADEERKKTILKRKLAVAKSFNQDLKKMKDLNLLSDAEHASILGEVNFFEGTNSWELAYRTSHLFSRLSLFMKRSPGYGESISRSEGLAYRLMPRWCYFSARILKNRLLARNGRARN